MNRTQQLLLLGALGWSVVSVPAQAAQGGTFSLTLGAEYTSGDYGTSQETEIWYFPATFKYETERNSIAFTVPVVIVDGPGTVVASGTGGMRGGIPSGTGSTTSRTEMGLGDIEIKGTLNLAMEDSYGPRIDLTGKVKGGTADRDDNLGTGEDDISIQVDLERTFGASNVFGSLGYKFIGDPPGVDYDNVLFGTIGTSYHFSGTTSVGVAFDAQQAPLPGAPSALEMSLFMSSQADSKTRVTGYVIKGLRDGSPDWGFGLMVKFTQ